MNRKLQKPARLWAEEIAEIPKLEDRRAALEKVPTELRPMTETHLKNLWLRKKKNEAS
ncbi:hypothetical protein [Cellvibrio mixtus]|uniref:hypothetical protein n=1 Tax=Cellvibrio mixtus TaxID=39650 RepID=UPI0013633194|nr:hypothetical protein [Cellvibrio mixtus]